MGDEKQPCRTLEDVLARLAQSPETLREMAKNLIEWSEQRMPIASFLQYVQSHSKTADEGRKARKDEENGTDNPGIMQDFESCKISDHRTSNLDSIETVATVRTAEDTRSMERVSRRLVTG